MDKRQVPTGLQYVLKFDKYFTDHFCSLAGRIYPLQKCRAYFTGLEISCHGIPWIAAWLASIWIIWNQSLFEMQINFFFGLMIDIIAICCVKAMARRRRPPSNRSDMLLAVGPDKFSFPSGHASRAIYIACFFTWLYPVNFLFASVIWIWAILISVSRILMRRHYVLDVIGGIALGLIESWIVYWMWFSESTSMWLISLLLEEDIEGYQAV